MKKVQGLKIQETDLKIYRKWSKTLIENFWKIRKNDFGIK